MGRLEGKTAIITGAARGMGAAFARLFVAEGAQVIITDILTEEGQALAAELGDKAQFMRLDVTNEDNWREMVDAIQKQYGTIDILVNNAGILHFAILEDTSADEFRKILDINLVGAHLGMAVVAPIMKKVGKGSIVNMSSADGLSGTNGTSAYAASKWGLRGLTKVAAMEFGPFGIRVNSVHPGGINTPMINPQAAPSEMLNQGFKGYPAQRVGEVDEVASAVLYLASDESSYCMGTELAVDGGMTSGHYYAGIPGAPAQ